MNIEEEVVRINQFHAKNLASLAKKLNQFLIKEYHDNREDFPPTIDFPDIATNMFCHLLSTYVAACGQQNGPTAFAESTRRIYLCLNEALKQQAKDLFSNQGKT